MERTQYVCDQCGKGTFDRSAEPLWLSLTGTMIVFLLGKPNHTIDGGAQFDSTNCFIAWMGAQLAQAAADPPI